MIRKKNNIKTIITVIVTLILVGLIIFFVGRSYGFFQYVKKGETTNVVSIKGIKINILEDDNALNLENAEPLYDKDGMELKAFKFSMTNTSSRPIEYTLKVVNDTDKQEACVLDEGTENEQTCPVLTTDNLRFSYKLNDEEYTSPVNLGGTNNDIITTYIINGKETLTYEIKIWIKSDATNEIMNHYFFGQLLIQGKQADHERIDYETLAPGLYDSNYKMLASWDTLVNDYGLDIEKDYTEEDMQSNGEEINGLEDIYKMIYENINPSSIGYILKNNEELKNGKILVLGDEVTRIGDGSMLSQDLEEVVISSGVTKISEGAFMTDHNLKSVVFKENSQLTTIGDAALELTGLQKINLPPSLTTIGAQAFAFTSIETLEVPSSVTSIGEMAFWGVKCLVYDGPAEDDNNWYASTRGGSTGTSAADEFGFAYGNKEKTIISGYVGDIKNVVIPSGVVEIDDDAFKNTEIESIYIPATVTKIGHYAFKDIKTLKKVEYENSMTIEFIGREAFANTGLQSIEMPVAATIYDDAFYGINTVYGYRQYGRWPEQNLHGALNLAQYVDGDFAYADSKKKILVDYLGSDRVVNVPSNVEYIYNRVAFMINGTTKIVNVPSTVKEIGELVFYFIPVVNYNGTATGEWGNMSLNPYIEGDFVYSDSTKTTLLSYIGDNPNVVIPSSVISIGRYAFIEYNSMIHNEKYDESTIKIKRIEKVIVPDSVTNIHEEAFEAVNIVVYNGSAEDKNKNNWKATNRNPYIEGNFAYSDSTKTTLVGYLGTDTTITIPSTVTVIGKSAFEYSKVKNVTLPNGITKLEDFAFYDSELESINIPGSLTNLGAGSLGYTKIVSMNVPSTVTRIGNGAFNGFNYINYTGTAIQESQYQVNWGAYAKNPYIEGDFIYSDSTKTTLERYTGNSKNVTIPSTVTTIGEYAFYETQIESVSLPAGLTTIGKSAFEYTNLTSVNLPSTLTTIGDYAFEYTGLTSISLPSGLTTIGNYVFAYTNLTTITIPSSVTKIGEYIIHETKVTSVVFEDPSGWYYKRDNIHFEAEQLSDPLFATVALKNKRAADDWTKS